MSESIPHEAAHLHDQVKHRVALLIDAALRLNDALDVELPSVMQNALYARTQLYRCEYSVSIIFDLLRQLAKAPGVIHPRTKRRT